MKGSDLLRLLQGHFNVPRQMASHSKVAVAATAVGDAELGGASAEAARCVGRAAVTADSQSTGQ